MIKNIVFDMGGVLIRFDQKFFIERLGISGEDAALLTREVFRSIEWCQMDRGTLEEEEAFARIRRRLPSHLHDAAEKLIQMWDRPILPIPGMEELVARLKERGYRIFLLSNASRRQPEYWARVPVARYFEDTLVSSFYQIVKPMPEIYRLAFEKFGIDPAESLFIDDLPVNCEAAVFCGMDAVVFQGDAAALAEALREKGVRV